MILPCVDLPLIRETLIHVRRITPPVSFGMYTRLVRPSAPDVKACRPCDQPALSTQGSWEVAPSNPPPIQCRHT